MRSFSIVQFFKLNSRKLKVRSEINKPVTTQATVGGSPFGPFISVARGHSRE